MSKPFDATLNSLIDSSPADWAAFLAANIGLTPGRSTVVDSDLSVTAQADKVFRIAGPPAALIHLELEADSRLGVPARLLRYNVLLGYAHPDEPVHSILLLLRPKANASDLTGVYTRAGADGRVYHEFRYTIVRVWEEHLARFLSGGPGTAPLALLTDEATADLPGSLTRFRDRLQQPDVDRKLAEELLGSAFVLCSLRHDPTRVAELYRSLVMTLEDSPGYLWILNKGVAQGAVVEARRMLLIQGRKRFGQAPPSAETGLQGITDPTRLERMAERIFDAADWDDLLSTA